MQAWILFTLQSTMQNAPPPVRPTRYADMRVILGAGSVKAYVVSPRSHHVIGIVRLGLEYGLLATDIQGDFYRVNGSQIVSLDAQQVLESIAHARALGRLAWSRPFPDPHPAPTVAVTILKRRHYVRDAPAPPAA